MSPVHALNGHTTPRHPASPASTNTVKNPLTPNRAGRLVENDEYAAFARRVLRAYARRVATGDVEALTLMLGLSAEIDDAIGQAVKACAASATPGPRSAPGSASPARPPSNAGAAPRDRRDSRPGSRTHHGLGTGGDRRRHRDRLLGRLQQRGNASSPPAPTRSGCAAASTPSTWPPANSPRSTTPPPSTGECCTSHAATAARPSARPARPSTSATPVSSSARAWPEARASPRSITAHPCVFATLTAPSFGPVHARRMRGKTVLPCRPRRDANARRCPHGRDISCPTRHVEADPRLGQPMCGDCYDYEARPCCSTPTRGTCGAGSSPTCPATWPAWPGSPRRRCSARSVSGSSRWPSTRLAASSTSTP